MLLDRVTIQLRFLRVGVFMKSAGGRRVAAQRRDVSHLGDFSATRRMLLITALAVPVGAVAAGVAWVSAADDRADHERSRSTAGSTRGWWRRVPVTTMRWCCCLPRLPAAW